MNIDKAPVTPQAAAKQLASHGYHVIPVLPGHKAAKDQGWQNLRLTPGQTAKHFKDDSNVGLLTGTEIYPGCFLIAVDIDVDDDDLIRNIACAFDGAPPGKRGKKGITYFAKMDAPAKKRAFNRIDPKTKARKQVVELMAMGQQVVIPPSIHPDTLKPYEWIGPSLLDIEPVDLPEFTETVLFEIELAVKRPDSLVFGLNTMEWLGENGGGNIHNSVTAAVASLVGHQWVEDAIWYRVDRATRRAVLAYGQDYDWPTWEEEVRDMVRSSLAKGHDKVTVRNKTSKHREAAQWYLQSYTGDKRIYYRDGHLAVYRRGAFDMKPKADIRHSIASDYQEPPGVSFAANDWGLVSDTILDMAARFPEHPPHRRVCLQNGTFDLDTGELGEWSENDFLISRLNFAHNYDAVCPVYDAFLQQTFAGNQEIDKCVNTWEEYVALTLFECHDYQKFLVIKGPPGTGKSTLVKLAKALHGEKAVSSVPVHKFGQERYQASMVGKLLNIVSEVQATDNATDDFIKAVTSGDHVEVRFLYKETYSVRLPTRLLIACNEMFRIRDTSGAVERRMIILQCPNIIEEENQDRQLNFKLSGELPGVFNRMAAAWLRLRKRGGFDPPKSSKADVSEFSADNNHTLAWFMDRTHEGMKVAHPEYVLPKVLNGTEVSMLFMDYTEWAKFNGFKTISSVTFGMRLSQLRLPGVEVAGKVKWVGGRAVTLRPIHLLNEGKY